MPDVNTTAELLLVSLGVEIGRAAAFPDACVTTVESLASTLGAPCLIRVQHGSRWHRVASAGDWADRMVEGAARIPLDLPLQGAELLIAGVPRRLRDTPADEGGRGSTMARVTDDPLWRDALRDVVTGALQLVHFRTERGAAERRAEDVGRFSRALLRIADSATLHRVIVETMARAVGADIGSLAIFNPQENNLSISATHGYPAVLVEHVRVAPGQGVLGRAFSTGEAILATNLAGLPGHVSRRRYRTDSFVALPLAGPDGVVAVVALTDKSTGDAFTEPDQGVLELLGAPAALAIARELLRDRTHDLTHLATVDPLTGLFNRRYFEARLEQEIQRQRRQSDELSLLMLDLDNFKELNDSQGHLVGDVALKEVADILRRAVRIFDVCGRYGGEEFVILMPGAAAATALRIAERIRRQVEQHFATGLRSGVPVPVTVSIGVSTALPNVTRDSLIADADAALLRAKALGKNRVNVERRGRDGLSGGQGAGTGETGGGQEENQQSS